MMSYKRYEVTAMESSAGSENNSARFADNASLQDAIRHRAQQLYETSGRVPGKDVENWMQAEREVLEAAGEHNRKAVVVRVNGVQYFGEYSAEHSDGYVPGEFSAGLGVSVRFDGNKMFLKRPNGKELETIITRTRK